MASPEVEAAQAALDAKKAELQARSSEFQALRATLIVAQATEEDDLDASSPGLINAIQNANGNAKNVLLVNLYRQRLREVLNAKNENQRARAEARAIAALDQAEL